MRSTAMLVAMSMGAAVLIASCAGSSNDVAPVTFESVPTTPVPTAPAVGPSTTTTSTVSSATTTPLVTSATHVVVPADSTTLTTLIPVTTVAGLTGPMFSDALGIEVDTAPGVHTPGDTRQLLPEGLYVHIAWTADPNDLSVFTARPEDIPILEAYANASMAYYRAFLTTRTTDAPEFDEYFVDGGAKYDANFAQARTGGYTGSLGNGVVLRPYIPADQRDENTAIVLDCYLENQEYLLPNQTPELGPLETSGTIATMVRTGGRWKVDIITTEPGACI